ncbi:MAG TPA: PH domain-containing protein [Candidatus Saccharimonadales bacterium]|nr:PH domain-containing protein [Candidatus Saccharimonadales bacterium]
MRRAIKTAAKQQTSTSKNRRVPHKYFSDQFDDEEVLYVFHQHPIVMRKGLVYGMFGPLVGILPTAIHPALGFGVFFGGLAAGFVLGCLILAPSWIGWYFSVFIVTDQRFIQIRQKGLFHRSVADLGLHQIQSVNYDISGLQETLLGFGTIKMQTYVGDLSIKDVHHPSRVQKRILGILRDKGITTNPNPSPFGNSLNETDETTQETESEAA